MLFGCSWVHIKGRNVVVQRKAICGSCYCIGAEIFGTLPCYRLRGHSSINATHARLERYFFWLRMLTDVLKFIKTCDTCARGNTALPLDYYCSHCPFHSKSGSIFQWILSSISPSLVLKIQFWWWFSDSKYAHFIGLSHPFSASVVTRKILDTVFRLHGAPQFIVFDRDKLLTSLFWKDLFKCLRIQLAYSSAYHSQSNGQTERVNQSVENYLRCMSHLQPKEPVGDWVYLKLQSFRQTSLALNRT